MAIKKELDQYYNNLYGKNFPSSTLSKWKKEGRIRFTEIPKKDRHTADIYDYNFEDFKTIVDSDEYKKKIKATKENPKDYIGKTKGYLYIQDIVPTDEKKDPKYLGTLMYCKCLKCNRPDLIQVRFSYLTPNGNYHQTTCGCNRKEQAFLATIQQDIDDKFLSNFDNFEKFLFIHKMITRTTDGYYNNCSIDEYKQTILYFYNDIQFNKIYNFWLNNQNNIDTFYDWAKPSLDHIIPKSKGGTHELDNLQVLTVFENLNKRDLTQKEWELFKQTTHTTSDYFIENIL